MTTIEQTTEQTAPMTVRLPIDVATRKGVTREMWEKTHDAPLRKHCAAEMQPLIFVHEYRTGFGTTQKRLDFTVDAYENGVVTYQPHRFARSSWEYRNLHNFGLRKGETTNA